MSNKPLITFNVPSVEQEVAAATRKNRYAQGFRIYSTAEAFFSDFGDDEQAINCANHFEQTRNKYRSEGC